MARLSGLIIVALFAGAAAAEVKPIEKVITLIKGLKKEVEDDGASEAKAYDSFACFCKTTTGEKSKSVNAGHDSIENDSADIGDKTQRKEDDADELTGRKKDHESLNKKLADTKSQCAKQKAEYQTEEADLAGAIKGLKDAIKAMKTTSLLQVSSTISQILEMAEAMGKILPKHKAAVAFLQQSTTVDPNDPAYKYHSNDIISVCEDLLKDYKDNKKTLDDEWKKTDDGCKQTIKATNKALGANQKSMDALKKSISKLQKEIAQHRGDLVEAQAQMQDDELYLKDLTARCEDRANDFDQRSAMRNDEITAFTEALKVLEGKVSDSDVANKRALLQKAAAPIAKVAQVAVQAKIEAPKAVLKTVSLLQEVSTGSKTFLGLSQQDKQRKAIDVLRTEGKRLGSVALTSLAERIEAPRFDSTAAADPFAKVKGLIQKLIERMLEESKNEASKKGFCDTELGKARQDRDFRFQEAKDLSADLAGLEAKRDALTLEIKQLKSDIKTESKALKDTTDDRNKEKKVNLKTLATAKEGLEGMNEAILILKSFYKQAAKASFIQASPVDEDTAGAGFKGNYGGKQGGMKAVFALLETIHSDFDRTIRNTEAAEEAAHRDYVDFSQAAQASIAGKEKKQELDEQDLNTTNTSIDTKTDDMQTAVNLLDQALMELEELKPTCIDTGMSYAKRVEKREEEIAALKKAWGMLGGQGDI